MRPQTSTPTIIAASHAPIQRLWIPSVRSVTPWGCASRLMESCSAVEQDASRRAADDTIVTRPILRTRLGSCGPTKEPLSQHTTDRQNVTTEAAGFDGRAGGSF